MAAVAAVSAAATHPRLVVLAAVAMAAPPLVVLREPMGVVEAVAAALQALVVARVGTVS
jgi:hypothetical protein